MTSALEATEERRFYEFHRIEAQRAHDALQDKIVGPIGVTALVPFAALGLPIQEARPRFVMPEVEPQPVPVETARFAGHKGLVLVEVMKPETAYHNILTEDAIVGRAQAQTA